MNLFEEFGQFGNANFYYAKDWKTTKFSDEFRQNFGTKEWDAATNTCKIYSNIHYQVVYASTGFTQKPQKYIVAIEKQTYQQMWNFNRKTASTQQLFELGVSFQFVELKQWETDKDGMIQAEPEEIPNDLLYPFLSKSAATSVMTTSAFLFALALIQN